jgi:hypothetical protein
MPELHMVAFLYGGRFFEWGRRLTGMGYVRSSVIGLLAPWVEREKERETGAVRPQIVGRGLGPGLLAGREDEVV